MHHSPRITWLVFIVGVIAVVDVLAWVSWRLVTLERQQQESRAEAARQEAIGRALWRMDSIVLPLLAVENARPYWEYQAFYPANRPADQMWTAPEPGDVLVPSPLLGEPGDLVRLHFERDATGRLTSPQAPGGEDRAAALAAGVPEALLAMADIRLYELDRLDGGERAEHARLGAQPGDETNLLDGIGFSRDRGIVIAEDQTLAPDRVLRIDPAETMVIDAPADDTSFGSWFDRASGEAPAREQATQALADADPAAGRSPAPDGADPQLTMTAGAARDESVPPSQDYDARQQAFVNAQAYNDAGRANRSRGYDSRAGYPAATPPVETDTRNIDNTRFAEEAGGPPAPGTGEGAPSRGLDRTIDSRREARMPTAPGGGHAPADQPAASPEAATATGAPRGAAGERRDESGASEPGVASSPGPNADATLETLSVAVARGSAGTSPAAPVTVPANELQFHQEGHGATMPEGVVPEAGPLAPMWRGSPAPGGEAALVLVRRVSVSGDSREQGVWIDWPALRRGLEASVADLFPLAEVQPVAGAASRAGASEAQRLATLPVVLIPGPLAAGILPAAPGFWTPTRWTLLVGWIAVGVAVVAIGIVLRKAIDLGERRGRFVSAVTHELRTPLTTFRLYSQMLAGQAAMDEAKRTRYAQTLDRESQRLSGIVESVLEYARLGRRAGGAAVRQRLDAAAILERVRPALAGRTERAGMELVLPEAPSLPAGSVVADPDKVERILLNLVDNACKYAPESPDRRIVIDAAARDGCLVLGVRDFGPGIPAGERRRIFDAFHRAKHHDASASPGLGLGLALSRGLAREMGGDLRLAESPGAGARFEVSIPLASSPRGGDAV